MQIQSKSKTKQAPPTWKDIRDAFLKSQVPEEDRARKFSRNRHLEGIALAIGFIGVLVAVSMLLAYVIVQAPQLRRKIGTNYQLKMNLYVIEIDRSHNNLCKCYCYRYPNIMF